MPKTTKNKTEDTTIEVHGNKNMPTCWADYFNIGVRADGMVLLRFFATLPEGVFEQARVITGQDHVKKILDTICSSLDYYPKKSPKKSNPEKK